MHSSYDEADDILTLRLADKAIAREVSQDWYTQLRFTADGSLVEVVILEASSRGAWPPAIHSAQGSPR